jgi:hypothetical protein
MAMTALPAEVFPVWAYTADSLSAVSNYISHKRIYNLPSPDTECHQHADTRGQEQLPPTEIVDSHRESQRNQE